MDSKLIKRTVMLAVSLILFLVLLVVYMNHKPGKEEGSGQSKALDTPEQSGQSEVTGQIGNNLSGFMKDEGFFDKEENPILEEAKNHGNRLSLIVTSVEKDIRVQIVDDKGIPVTGKSFYVQVEGEGEYKDLDQDGIIYIGNVTAGEYAVSLLPVEGYKVPTNVTRIRVKDHVEYLAIQDISLLIKTEAEIDAEAEDTGEKDAVQDADKTEIKKLQAVSGESRVGIDVSKWNGEIDWDKVRRAGVEFAIIRAGYRGSSTGSLVEDPYFVQNMRGAQSAGVEVGVYFFTQAVNEVEAVEEASMMMALTKDYVMDFPIFIDTEGAGGEGRADGLDAYMRTKVCRVFCETLENEGYLAGVYASRNWYNTHLDTSELDEFSIWLAEYRSAPLYQGYYEMWQYTSKGKVDGIDGNVDMNICYVTYQ
jgi:GH25 family lysozyme M1 (1,4-beta-N-acetylmuramidase)